MFDNLKNTYAITKEEIEKLEDIASYFRYHNKNLTNNQYYMIDTVLNEIIDHLNDYYVGNSYKDIDYLKNI